MAALDQFEMKNCCLIIISFLYSLEAQVNGRSHQSNSDLVRYLDRSIKTEFSGDQKRSRGGQFYVRERGLFAQAETPATNSGRSLYTLQEV